MIEHLNNRFIPALNDVDFKYVASTESGMIAAESARRDGSLWAREAPPHLVPLAGGTWGLWRWFGLRSAGFEAAGVLRLAAPESAQVVDALLEAEAARDARLREAVERLSDDLDSVERQERFRRFRVLERLNKGKRPRPRDGGGPAIDAFVVADDAVAEVRGRLGEVFEDEVVELNRALRRVAEDNGFRMAVTWQNRKAVHTGLDALLSTPANGYRNSAERRLEQVVTSYLQRYCTKNDTIGWFGPVGWGTFRPGGEPISLEPGERLVAERYVRFENWCVDEVAEALLGDPEVRPWLAPRAMPFFLLQGDLYVPLEGAAERFDADTLALFRACDGRRSALRIADDLAADAATGFTTPEGVLERLGALAERMVIVWRPELPLVRRAERPLRRLVESIDDPELREPRLARVEELEEHRDAVADAATADELDRALAALEAWFSEVTGEAPTRFAGRTYAGRTLIHEDCLRDVDLALGDEPLESLGPTLELLLRSARWFTYELSRRWTDALETAHRDLREETGEPVIPLFRFLEKVRPIVLEPDAPMAEEVATTMQRRWAEILGVEEGARRVEWDGESLRARVEESFDAPGPGWLHARQQCPDILLAADGPEAIRRGDYRFVLGEVHLSTNTLRTRVAADTHPDQEALLEAITWDIPEPTVVPWLPRQRRRKEPIDPLGLPISATSARLDFGLLTRKDVRLSVSMEPPTDLEVPTAFVGDFVVAESDGDLRVRSLDGRYDFGVMDFFDIAFTAQTTNMFRVLPRDRHVPRVTIDRLVVQRETWKVPARELEFAAADSESERFVGVRRWARSLGLPRFVFGRSPYESKPFFVDLDSPPAVEVLCRVVRGARERGDEDTLLGFSEMLPGPHQCWLTDAEGRRFTSEIRIVAVDLAPGGVNAGCPRFDAIGEEG
jgi:hypothetical protein